MPAFTGFRLRRVSASALCELKNENKVLTLASATINSASLSNIEFMTNGINDGIEISLVNTGLLQGNSITFTIGDMGTSTYNA